MDVERITDWLVIGDILLTHGHDDHTGSAAALAERTGARLRQVAATL